MRLHMASTEGVPYAGRVQQLRGLQVLPTDVDFGPVQEGRTYATSVQLLNAGIETAHVRIAHAPGTGLDVRYTPMAIPAGLSLSVQLLFTPPSRAQDASIRSFADEISIASEAELLRVRVHATVLSAQAYTQISPPPLPAAGVRCIHAAD